MTTIKCDKCGKAYELNSDEFGDLSLLDLSCVSLFGHYICRDCYVGEDND